MAPPELRGLGYGLAGLASTLRRPRLLQEPVSTPVLERLTSQPRSRPGTLRAFCFNLLLQLRQCGICHVLLSRIVQPVSAGGRRCAFGSTEDQSAKRVLASSGAIAASKAAMTSAWVRTLS